MLVDVRSDPTSPPPTPLHVVSSACPAPSFVHLAINYVYVLLEFSLHASNDDDDDDAAGSPLCRGDSFT